MKATLNIIQKRFSRVFPIILLVLVSSFAAQAHSHNKEKKSETEEVKLAKAIEEMETYFHNQQKDLNLLSSPRVYNFTNEREEIIYTEVNEDDLQKSQKLQELIRKSDFLLEANNTYYFKLYNQLQ